MSEASEKLILEQTAMILEQNGKIADTNVGLLSFFGGIRVVRSSKDKTEEFPQISSSRIDFSSQTEAFGPSEEALAMMRSVHQQNQEILQANTYLLRILDVMIENTRGKR